MAVDEIAPQGGGTDPRTDGSHGAVEIDHVETLCLSSSDTGAFGNELSCLRYLRAGLDLLFETVKQVEHQVLTQMPQGRRLTWMGVPPEGLEWVPQDLLCCLFHWYGVSAYNYAVLVGHMAHSAGILSEEPDKYAARVLPEITQWRNKVAAHFAKAKPSKKDTPADLLASVIYPLAFCESSFFVSAFVPEVIASGEPSQTALSPWSLTAVHPVLRGRYWPQSEQARS